MPTETKVEKAGKKEIEMEITIREATAERVQEALDAASAELKVYVQATGEEKTAAKNVVLRSIMNATIIAQELPD